MSKSNQEYTAKTKSPTKTVERKKILTKIGQLEMAIGSPWLKSKNKEEYKLRLIKLQEKLTELA